MRANHSRTSRNRCWPRTGRGLRAPTLQIDRLNIAERCDVGNGVALDNHQVGVVARKHTPLAVSKPAGRCRQGSGRGDSVRSGTTARISSLLNCGAAGSVPGVLAPPPAMIFTVSTPRSARSGTARRNASMPWASPPMFQQWPCGLVIGGPLPRPVGNEEFSDYDHANRSRPIRGHPGRPQW
jgi:hypothetical protein